MRFEAIHSNHYIPHMNDLLLRGFWQITRYAYAYNIVSYLNTFYYPKCLPS